MLVQDFLLILVKREEDEEIMWGFMSTSKSNTNSRIHGRILFLIWAFSCLFFLDTEDAVYSCICRI